jgi:magnesium transporter
VIQYKNKVAAQDKMVDANWVRVERPSVQEIRTVVGAFGLDTRIINDALDPHEVPRLEIVDPLAYFIARLPDTDDDFNDFTTPIMFALHPEYIITISRDSLARMWQPFIDDAYSVSASSLQLLAKMLGAIIQEYHKKVAAINRQMRAVSTDITVLRPKDIGVFVEYERKLNDYVDALLPLNDAIETYLRTNTDMSESDQDLLEKVSIDFNQVIARSKSLLRTITNVRDSFRAVMDTRLNETMRLLTVITLALTVPTTMAGLYGMNVALPGQESLPMFWVIALVSLATSMALIFFFLVKRR